MRVIVYGKGDNFDPAKFKQVKNRNFVKPDGGMWASPVDSEFGRKEWCEQNDFGDLGSSFEVEIVGRILTIDSLKDAKGLPWLSAFDGLLTFPDLEATARTYDAIHLTPMGESETRFSSPSLYGWDCECVLVLNPNCIRLYSE